MGIERFSHDELKAIKKLQSLRAKIGSEDAEPRIEFAKTLLEFRTVPGVNQPRTNG